MSELVLLKLGGSVITDKRRRHTAQLEVIHRLAREIAAVQHARPDLRLVLGHGSGSFGHYEGARYGVREGYLRDWRGYVETSAAAQRLNRLVTDIMIEEGVPVVSLQPSASARCRDGVLVRLAAAPVEELLERRLVPLVYGDVALDEVRGCTIVSTERIFGYLAGQLRPARVLVASEVAGVFTADPQVDASAQLIPVIGPDNYEQIERQLSHSHGVDVTGGMLGKVQALYGLVVEHPDLTVRIFSGRIEGAVQRTLEDPYSNEGTLLKH